MTFSDSAMAIMMYVKLDVLLYEQQGDMEINV